LGTDEIDASWNFLYFGYDSINEKFYAALKGSKSDIQVKTVTGVAHSAVPAGLTFQVGSPGV
jgi:hypothetical protein